MFEEAEDGVQEFAQDRHQGLPFGFTSGEQALATTAFNLTRLWHKKPSCHTDSEAMPLRYPLAIYQR